MPLEREPYDPSFGSKVLAEAFHPTLQHYFRTYTPHRLTYQASWLWCGIQDEDANRYACLREWKTEYSFNVLVSKFENDPQKVGSRVYRRLNMGMIDFEMDQDQQAILVYPTFAPHAFHVTLRPQHFRWKDADGELDLEFRALGPALKYLCPGEREDEMYMSEFCRVTGTLQGSPVKGFGGIDCSFGTPGIGWLQSKIYRLLEKYWIVWANRYDDDSVEYGICFDGEADFNLAFVVRDGTVGISDCSIDMKEFDDGFPRQATVTMADEEYRFDTTARVSKIKGFMQWASGQMNREGDPRKIVERFGWLEFFG
jgi:hypothetical protein